VSDIDTGTAHARYVDGVIAPVVDVAWVREHPDAVLADVRWYLGRGPGTEEYAAGHLPGAVFVDVDTVLAAPPSPKAGRHPLPDPQAFARAMGALGIGDGDTVVAYDDAGGVNAARLVWMLRALGRDAALLDGGITAWDGPLEASAPERAAAVFTAPAAWPAELLASIDDAADPSNVVLDARQRERFEGGAPDPVDPRAGHVPGARSLSARDNLGPDGRLLPREALRERFATVGVGPESPVVSYCGSGVTACHTLIALEHAGLGTGRLYPGSWSQWANDPERPAATGPR
jgi:thiosulfate/3-mercaptopyruvate sulfurtransferase